MKIPTGYYDRAASLGKYLQKEFAKNPPIKGHEELSACEIHTFTDTVNLKISLSTKTIVDFRMITLNEHSNAHLGAV